MKILKQEADQRGPRNLALHSDRKTRKALCRKTTDQMYIVGFLKLLTLGTGYSPLGWGPVKRSAQHPWPLPIRC